MKKKIKKLANFLHAKQNSELSPSNSAGNSPKKPSFTFNMQPITPQLNTNS